MRATIVAARTDAAIVVGVQVGRVAAAVSRSRPIVAVVTDTDQTADVPAAKTRSRVPDGRSTTKFAGEVHALVSAVIVVLKRFKR